MTDDTLRNEFSKYGEVLHAIVLKDMATQMVSGATPVPLPAANDFGPIAADCAHGYCRAVGCW